MERFCLLALAVALALCAGAASGYVIRTKSCVEHEGSHLVTQASVCKDYGRGAKKRQSLLVEIQLANSAPIQNCFLSLESKEFGFGARFLLGQTMNNWDLCGPVSHKWLDTTTVADPRLPSAKHIDRCCECPVGGAFGSYNDPHPAVESVVRARSGGSDRRVRIEFENADLLGHIQGKSGTLKVFGSEKDRSKGRNPLICMAFDRFTLPEDDVVALTKGCESYEDWFAANPDLAEPLPLPESAVPARKIQEVVEEEQYDEDDDEEDAMEVEGPQQMELDSEGTAYVVKEEPRAHKKQRLVKETSV